MRDYFAPWVERRRQRVVDMFRPAVTYDVGKVAALSASPTTWAFTRSLSVFCARSSTRARVTACGRSRVALEWVDWSNRTVDGRQECVCRAGRPPPPRGGAVLRRMKGSCLTSAA